MTGKGFTIHKRGQLNRFAVEPKVYIDEAHGLTSLNIPNN